MVNNEVTPASRIRSAAYREKIVSAEQAARFISNDDNVGMSGFVGAGCPKEVPLALAEIAKEEHARGVDFGINIFTGASTSPEIDGALAEAGGIKFRTPFQSSPILRKSINSGAVAYQDVHLSHIGQQVRQGYWGKLDVALIEVSGITEDGQLIPSSSIGNNKTWLDLADKVIIEVNSWQPEGLNGMHDVYPDESLPPFRKPIELGHPADRIGDKYLQVDFNKVVAVVEGERPDRNSPFAPADEVSAAIAGYIIDFFDYEVKHGRLPKDTLLPLQCGVGNVPNAVLSGLVEGGYKGLTAFSEVIQDGMLSLIKQGTIAFASATGLSLSPDGFDEFKANTEFYSDKILLRQQEISNAPELIRRLGIVGINGMIEADIYGNVNSTHVMGTGMMNGIGGSGDFVRNAQLSFFTSPSTAKGGAISAIVPFASHIDHTEHDTQILVTEQGIADTRGLSPRQRSRVIIEKCAHPDFKPLLEDYVARAEAEGVGGHTPHLLDEALSWHQRFKETGTMLP